MLLAGAGLSLVAEWLRGWVVVCLNNCSMAGAPAALALNGSSMLLLLYYKRCTFSYFMVGGVDGHETGLLPIFLLC